MSDLKTTRNELLNAVTQVTVAVNKLIDGLLHGESNGIEFDFGAGILKLTTEVRQLATAPVKKTARKKATKKKTAKKRAIRRKTKK